MAGVVARGGCVVAVALACALACGGKATGPDDLFEGSPAGGEAGETTGGRVAGGRATGGAPVATGGVPGVPAGGTAPDRPGGDAGVGGEPPLCLLSQGCGDGVVQICEECDDGNANNHDDCLNTCELPTCGDGILHDQGSGYESCDEGEDNGPYPARSGPRVR
jgi:cysteine-rich repeat protein